MIYPIILYPDRLLMSVSEEVTEITDELIDMLDNMQETMKAHDGVGLAAPQIGKRLQVAVIQLDEEEVLELINPIIIDQSGETIDVEACLSIPDQYGTVSRAEQIVLRYFDRQGLEYEMEASDYLARIIQHEVDHLNGKVFIDQVVQRLTREEAEKYMEEKQDD